MDVLMSRPYFQSRSVQDQMQQFVDQGYVRDLLIDCGAFTYHKKGKTVTVQDYMAWLKTIEVPLWGYFALDVLGDPAGTMDNLRRMVDAGFRPIPVWQPGINREQLDEMYQVNDVVAVGGLVGRHSFLRWILKKVWPKGRKAHFLGIGTPEILSAHNPYSSDSSTFNNAAQFGRLSTYLGHNRWTHILKYGMKPTPQQMNVYRRMGYDPAILKNPEHWRRTKFNPPPTVQLSLISWQRWCLDLRSRGLTKLFLVFVLDGSTNIIPLAVERAGAIHTGAR